MSNLIRGNYIHYSQQDAIVIDSDAKSDSFQTLNLVHAMEVPKVEKEVAKEKEEEEIIPDLAQVKEYAESMLVEAREEAKRIVDKAKQEALSILNQAREEGHQEGFASGLSQIEEEKQKLEQDIADAIAREEASYQKMKSELEPKFADLTMKLVEKLTGVIVEDKKDLLVYLISTTLSSLKGPKQFTIRVSKDDIPLVTQRKEELENLLAEGCTMEILEDSTLIKDQCFIETEDRLLDVSLDVQLKNLKEHIKMLS